MAASAAITPPARFAASTIATQVTAAAVASTNRAALTGVAPAATPTAMVAGKPGGKCTSGAVESLLDHDADGTRSPWPRPSDAPAPR